MYIALSKMDGGKVVCVPVTYNSDYSSVSGRGTKSCAVIGYLSSLSQDTVFLSS